MGRFRYSIAGLVGVVSFVAIALAALREANDAWDSGVFGLALLILLTATLLAVHRTERRRAYWLGFALFGWMYLIASLIPPIGWRLPTTRGFIVLDSKIPGRQTTWVAAVLGYPSTNMAGTQPVPSFTLSPPGDFWVLPSQGNAWLWDATTGKLLTGSGSTSENFIRIGHSVLALIVAFVGGYLSRYLYHTGQRQPSNTEPVSSSPP